MANDMDEMQKKILAMAEKSEKRAVNTTVKKAVKAAVKDIKEQTALGYEAIEDDRIADAVGIFMRIADIALELAKIVEDEDDKKVLKSYAEMSIEIVEGRVEEVKREIKS
jgi:hypothetical protein